VVHINFTAAEVNELYQPITQIIGDIGNTLRQIYEANVQTNHRDFDKIYQLSEIAKQAIQTNTDTAHNNKTITPGWLIRTLRQQLDDDAIVSLDNGLYKVWFARNYLCYHPNTLLLDNALATM
jgi:acetolactate synthase-1/2/3 large subunit